MNRDNQTKIESFEVRHSTIVPESLGLIRLRHKSGVAQQERQVVTLSISALMEAFRQNTTSAAGSKVSS